jgi:hypothetical protein
MESKSEKNILFECWKEILRKRILYRVSLISSNVFEIL